MKSFSFVNLSSLFTVRQLSLKISTIRLPCQPRRLHHDIGNEFRTEISSTCKNLLLIKLNHRDENQHQYDVTANRAAHFDFFLTLFDEIFSNSRLLMLSIQCCIDTEHAREKNIIVEGM